MKKLLTLAAGFAACLGFGETLDTSSFNRVCPFTFASYQGESTLTNFPVAVRLSESIDGFLYSDCATDGSDLRFADADGNLIPHEIEYWNTSGESIVWVRVPSLAGTSTRIRLYYGQKADTTLPTVTASDVWTKYVAVVHGGSGFADSSPKAVAVANGGGVTASMTSGVIGGGFNKSARSTVGVNVANPMKNSYLTDNNALTLSAWYRYTSSGTDCIASSKTAWGGTGFLLLCEQGTYMSCAVQSTHQGASGKGALVQNSWNHVGFTYLTSGSTATLNTYFDGALIYSNASAKSLGDEGRDNWTFGGYAQTANSGNHIGDMDELRIYDGIASADWMQAEHDAIAVSAFAAPGTVLDISSGRTPSSVTVSATTNDASGIVLVGRLEQICDGATSVAVTLKWGTTEALEGEAVSVGTFTQIGTTFAVTLPATQVGATYYYAFVLTPDTGTADTTATASVLFAGTGPTWRPSTANDTWSSTSWQVADKLYPFTDLWSATFDGAEPNYYGTIKIPTNVVADVVTVTGAKDYTMSGAGTITATKLVKSGSGTLTAATTQFVEPLNVEVTAGNLALSGSFATSTTSTLTVGGGTELAGIVLNNNDAKFGDSTGDAIVTVRTNGFIRNSQQWTRFSAGPGTHCTLVVEAGGEINASSCMIGSWAGSCTARVAGTITVRDNYFGVGEGSNSSLILLPGGRIRARGSQAWSNSTTWSGYTGVSTIRVDDGTFEMYPVADYGTSTPILNTLVPVTYEHAITFDIPSNGVTCCKAAITNVTESGTARFIKKGTGILMYQADAKGITGVIDVQEGILTFSQEFAADADVTFTLAAGAGIGCNVAGGLTNILARLSKDSAGTICICDNNASDTIDLTEYPNLQVAMLTTAFKGQIIRADNQLTLDLEGRTVWFTSVLADVEGHPATLTITDSVGGGMIYMQSTNTTMTGGVTVKDKVRLVLYGPSGNAYAVGPSGPVKLESGTTLQLDATDIPVDFVKNRVTDDSDPAYIFVQSYAAACNVDVSRFPNCRVGIAGNTSCTMTGTLTPSGDTYLLGGGDTAYASSYSGLRPGTLMDDGDTPRAVVVDRAGLINLSNSANTYSGGTVITNSGRVYVAGTDGFGKVPAEFDADNIYVNGGVLRHGSGNTTIAATRGIWVGDDGLIFHPWGGYTMTVAGGLGGTGDISVTDGGHLTLTGAYNTWNGHLTFNYASTFTIGDGTHFSWASTGGIETKNAGGAVVLKTNTDDAVFPDTVTGVAPIRKEGTGTLTITAEQKSTGRTTVSSGTLRLTDAAKLATNANIWNLSDIFVDRAGTATDVFGSTTILGTGTIRFRDSVDPTIDRALPGLAEVSVATNHSATFTTTAPETTITLGGEATATFAASSVEDFGDFTFNGTANRISAGVLQITPATGSKAGSAYWNQAVDLTQPWEARFTYQTVNPPSNPADGFAFVLQRMGKTALGAVGGSIGINTVTPSFGFAFNIYGTDSIGWVLNGAKTDMSSSINGLDLVKGVDVVVTYDGLSLFKVVFTQGDNTYTLTRTQDLVSYLGGTTAWVGFAGGTGGAVCDQRIANFSFTEGAAPQPLDMTVSDSLWQTNGVAICTELNDVPAFRLTDAIGTSGSSGSVVRKEMISTRRAFKITGKYIYTGTTTGTPADGAAIFLHNNGTTAIGGTGGYVGVNGVSTAIGWKLNIYGSSQLVPVTNGGFGSADSSLNGVNFLNQTEVAFTLAYTPGTLSLTVAQGTNSKTVSLSVDLSTYFNLDRMYFAMSGGTGGKDARQYVYDLAMEYTDDDSDTAGAGYGALACAGTDTVKVAAKVGGLAEFGTLTLGTAAVVNVEPTEPDASYALGARKVVFEGAASTRTIALATGGTLRLGTIVHDGSHEGNVIKITGALAPLDEKITLRVPRVRGLVKVLDLTEATGVTLDDFVLDTDETEGASLVFRNGILYACRNVGTVLFLR